MLKRGQVEHDYDQFEIKIFLIYIPPYFTQDLISQIHKMKSSMIFRLCTEKKCSADPVSWFSKAFKRGVGEEKICLYTTLPSHKDGNYCTSGLIRCWVRKVLSLYVYCLFCVNLNVSCIYVIVQLMARNWQKWKRVFLTCPCHEIYRDEAVGLKSCKYSVYLKNLRFMWIRGIWGNFVKILYFVNNCLIEVQI